MLSIQALKVTSCIVQERIASVADDELLFFQLPSILPQFEKVNHEPVEITDSKDKQLPPAAKKSTLESAMGSLSLGDMPQGQVGSLVVYKSGKMKLKIGDVLFDITQGMQSSFLENAMMVDTLSEDKKKVIELGNLTQKFVCMPDMDALLEEESVG